MENNYDQIMSSKTTEELIYITKVAPDDYREEALVSARTELERRNISLQEIKDTTQIIVERVDRIAEIESNTVSSGIRFLNFLIDLLAYLFIAFVLTYYLDLGRSKHLFIDSSILFATYILYYTIFEMKCQQTLGKMLTKTKVVTQNEEVPSFVDIIIRSITRVFPFDHFSFLLMRNGLHDRLSNTKVIKTNKKTTDR